jgi:hypothetical protein
MHIHDKFPLIDDSYIPTKLNSNTTLREIEFRKSFPWVHCYPNPDTDMYS